MNSHSEIYHRRLLYVSRETINRFTLQMVDPELFTNANLIYGWPDSDEAAELDTYYSLAVHHQDDQLTTAQLCSLNEYKFPQSISDRFL